MTNREIQAAMSCNDIARGQVCESGCGYWVLLKTLIFKPCAEKKKLTGCGMLHLSQQQGLCWYWPHAARPRKKAVCGL